VAKECARMILPNATMTRLYMKGNLRSWITYIALREKSGTQLEHKKVAWQCKRIFNDCFPVVSAAIGGLEKEWII
jgi:thymidylate synthase (FAD)